MNVPSPEGIRALARSKVLGRISAFLFLLAAFCIADAVQSMLRTPFNRISVIAGESAMVTGGMPVDAEGIENLVFTLENAKGLSFKFTESYRGFWMGGTMWRGILTAESGVPTHEAALTVIDHIPADQENSPQEQPLAEASITGGQNPGLVFPIDVWARSSEEKRHAFSAITRAIGLPPYIMAVLSLLSAIGTGVASFMFFRNAEKKFVTRQVFIIHGVKSAPGGFTVLFTTPRGVTLPSNRSLTLYRPDGRELGEGIAAESEPGKGAGYFAESVERPKYGWLVALEKAPSYEGSKLLRPRKF